MFWRGFVVQMHVSLNLTHDMAGGVSGGTDPSALEGDWGRDKGVIAWLHVYIPTPSPVSMKAGLMYEDPKDPTYGKHSRSGLLESSQPNFLALVN